MSITGGSAGGHSRRAAALTADDPQFQPGFEDVDTSVVAAVPYGRYDWVSAQGNGRKEFLAFLQKFVVKKPIQANPAGVRRAHPRVTGCVPTRRRSSSCTDKTIRSFRSPRAAEFAQALREVSTSLVVYAEIPHAQHAFDFYYGSPRAHYTAQAVEEFLHWVQAGRQAIKGAEKAG